MSFFNSEIVRAEMTEISEIQEEIYGSIFKFPYMDKEDKIRHIDLLETLLKKQQVLYTRLSLSDDPEAKEMKKKIMDSALVMGLNPSTDMNIIFNNMSKILEAMKSNIDKREPGVQTDEVHKTVSNLSEVYKWHLPILKNNPNLVL